MIRFKRGRYQVTRFCCTSGMCIRCQASGDRGKRKRMVHTDRVSKAWANRVAANWNRDGHGFNAIAELMP
jgi:hypothetical protein